MWAQTRLAAIAILAAPASPALALDGRWALEAVLGSEFVGKGVGRSDGEPHVSLQVQRLLAGGAYVGARSGSIRNSLGADAEAQIFVGWRSRLAGWSFDARPALKLLVNTGADVQTRQVELRLDAARPVAGARLRLRLEQGLNGFGAARASTWAEASLSRPLADTGWALIGGIGRRELEIGRDYTAWHGGVQHHLAGPLSAEVRWVDTNQSHAGRNYKGRLVFGVTARLN